MAIFNCYVELPEGKPPARWLFIPPMVNLRVVCLCATNIKYDSSWLMFITCLSNVVYLWFTTSFHDYSSWLTFIRGTPTWRMTAGGIYYAQGVLLLCTVCGLIHIHQLRKYSSHLPMLQGIYWWCRGSVTRVCLAGTSFGCASPLYLPCRLGQDFFNELNGVGFSGTSAVARKSVNSLKSSIRLGTLC